MVFIRDLIDSATDSNGRGDYLRKTGRFSLIPRPIWRLSENYQRRRFSRYWFITGKLSRGLLIVIVGLTVILITITTITTATTTKTVTVTRILEVTCYGRRYKEIVVTALHYRRLSKTGRLSQTGRLSHT